MENRFCFVFRFSILDIKKEIDAFIGYRLLEAMWRESLWLVKDGVATAETIDDVVRYGLGLRYAQMGQFMTYRLGGGEAGMERKQRAPEPNRGGRRQRAPAAASRIAENPVLDDPHRI